MRHLKIILLFALFPSAIFTQPSLDAELKRLEETPGITVNFIDDNRLAVNYDGIKTRVFYIGDKLPSYVTPDTIPSFVFNISELDTSLFNHLFYLWQEVPVASSFNNPTIGDIDNDGRAEIYGRKRAFFGEPTEVYCYEQDEFGIFQSAYKYDENTRYGKGIYDVNRDGVNELHLLAVHFDSVWSGYIDDQTFFNSPLPNTLATEFYFDYNIYRGDGNLIQLNDFTVGDFNNDNINEAIFFSISPRQIWMTKFNEEELTFDSLLSYLTWQYPGGSNEYVVGFVVDDFDMDRNTDILYSSEYGHIYLLEHNSGDNYTINWNGNSGILNSYMIFNTKDIDKNGKPEFWVGGEDFDQGVTMVTCFETTGNNSYEPIAKILLPNLLSLNGIRGTAFDVDIDNNEEIFIRVGKRCIIIKFIGTPNNHDYEVYYYYQADNIVLEANLFQFPADDRPSIVMSMYESENGNRRDFSHILRHHLTTDLKNENSEILVEYKIFNNYPNPFNPTTTISFSIPQVSNVTINIYNTIGEEVITLLNQSFERGEHKIIWNGRDKNNSVVPSGVYFISLKARSTSTDRLIQKTIKSVLLK